MSARTRDSSRYWGTQIWASALFVVLGFGGGVVILASDSEEKGQGVMLLFTGALFLATLIWLIRQRSRMTPEQRAIYAWAILQQHSAGGGASARRVSNDLQMMGVAARARDGLLSRDEIRELEALRPGNPYPGTLPPPTGH